MSRIYISHSLKHDRELVRSLRNALQASGFELVELEDSTSIAGDISSAIISRIRSADMVLAIVRPNRPSVVFEIGYAMGAGKSVLLIAEMQAELPLELQSLPCVRLTERQESSIPEVVRRITALAYSRVDRTPKVQSKQLYKTAEEELRTYHDNPDYFESLDWRRFEKLLIDFFRKKGFSVHGMPHSANEPGYDFSLELSDGRKIIVEAKKTSRQSKVSINHIRSLLDTASLVGASAAMLITPSGFTASASALAASTFPKLLLVTLERLLATRNEQELLALPRTVFISHNWHDKSVARRLAKDLNDRGIGTWLDEAEIKIGDSLIDKMKAGIESVEYLVILLSKASTSSEWVKREVDIAMNQEIEGKNVKVLPVLLEHCDLPVFLRDKCYVDLTTESNYDVALRQIEERLRA